MGERWGVRVGWGAGIASLCCAFAGFAGANAAPALGQCVPIPPVTSCPPPPSQTSQSPSVSDIQGQATGFKTARLGGTINPGGETTTYYWTVEAISGFGRPIQTTTATLPASTSPQTVTATVSGLTPDTDYEVQLFASNGDGANQGYLAPAFRTPHRVRLSVSAPDRDSIVLSFTMSLDVSVRMTGEFNPTVPLTLQYAINSGRWRRSGGNALLGRNHRAKIDFCPPAAHDNGCPVPQQNFWLRAAYDKTHSRPLRIYVYPSVQVSVEREQEGASPWIDAELEAGVHYLPHRHRYHTQLAYFYQGSSRRGPFVRVSRAYFRVESDDKPNSADVGGATLIARTRIYSPRAGVTFACYRHQLLTDMGRPYLNRRCGTARLG